MRRRLPASRTPPPAGSSTSSPPTMPRCPTAAGGAFFTDEQRGWMGFLVRYLHYVMFGLDPNGADIALLTDLHYSRLSPLHYLAEIGSLLQNLNLLKHGDLPDLIERAATVYEQSACPEPVCGGQPRAPQHDSPRAGQADDLDHEYRRAARATAPGLYRHGLSLACRPTRASRRQRSIRPSTGTRSICQTARRCGCFCWNAPASGLRSAPRIGWRQAPSPSSSLAKRSSFQQAPSC